VICSIVSGSVTPLPLASWPTNSANGGELADERSGEAREFAVEADAEE